MNLDINQNKENFKNLFKKHYKDDFFSNWESYHVCEDYAMDILAHLKSRDVTF